jgi:thiosulfate dehydrogenase
MLRRIFYSLFIIGLLVSTYYSFLRNAKEQETAMLKRIEGMDTSAWVGSSANHIPVETENGNLIRYGYELIAHTSKYLGPKGTVQQTTNGMNCQNCHLEAGTKPWGLNYGSVYSSYPKFRERSGSLETIYKRVNDCMERSLNGKALDTNSKEMKAIYAYIKWLGNDVTKGKNVKGSGIEILPYLKTAASPTEGKISYVQNCQRCHGANGEGVMDSTGNMYLYPPVWGKHSYNDAAGLFQLSKLAGFIKNNMPNGINYHTSSISIQDAWNLAAYINA